MPGNLVSIFKQNKVFYPKEAPYNPPQAYPELREFFDITKIDPTNEVYSSIRESFHLLKYDIKNYSTTKWNPFGWLVKRGETVFLKPNMLAEYHKENDDWNCVITHGSVIRAVIDYIFLALRGEGRVIIGDAPQTDSNFFKIVDLLGLEEIRKHYQRYKDFDIEIINLQDEYWQVKKGIYLETIRLPGDPRGRIEIDLGKNSMFREFDGKNKLYYGAFYDIKETNEHHKDGKHEYAISRSPFVADVFINIPKLKTHKKCGVTVNLKGLVGINANKNWLPHYVFGSPVSGGDQFPQRKMQRELENKFVIFQKKNLLKKNTFLHFLARKFVGLSYKIFGSNKKVIRSGNWYGNDTVWRMALDLNRILMYAKADGTMNPNKKQKRFFSIVDGIISMEGDGPRNGTKKETGLIISGDNPVSVDTVCAKIMGFDYKKLPLIFKAFEPHEYPLTNIDYKSISVMSNIGCWNRPVGEIDYSDSYKFKPHFGWLGKIEESD